MALVEGDVLWARAWLRILRGEPPWPSKASFGTDARERSGASAEASVSIWTQLGVAPNVSETELKAAYRQRAFETHPDRGGAEEAFRAVVRVYQEALKRIRRPRRRGSEPGA
jgi:hypothetical protein